MKDKYLIILKDMQDDRKDKSNTEYWNHRLDQKIADWEKLCREQGYLNGSNA